MTLPTLPSSGPKDQLSDSARDLQKQLAAVGEAMRNMTEAEAAPLQEALKRIAQEADKAGPDLKKLFAVDPAGARAMKRLFEDVMDAAATMSGRVKEKAEIAAKATQKAAQDAQEKDDDKHSDNMRGTARVIRNLPSGGAGGLVTAGLAAAGPEGEVIAAGFQAAAGAIEQAADALKSYAETAVQASNPGIWQRYQRSLEDLSAVFGNAFAPIFEEATRVADQLNGVLTQIAPIISDIVSEVVNAFQPVWEAVLPILQEIGQTFKSAWAGIGPLFSELMQGIRDELVAVVQLVQAVGEALQSVAEVFAEAFAPVFTSLGAALKDWAEDTAAVMIVVVKSVTMLLDVFAALGRQMAKGKPANLGDALKEASGKSAERTAAAKKAATDTAANKTFAARPAEFGDITAIGQKAQLAAASGGTGGGPKPVEEGVDELGKKVDEILKLFTPIGKFFTDFANLAVAAEGLIHDPAKAGKQAIGAEARAYLPSWAFDALVKLGR